MQTIETGYKPDGALGALYAGQNSANAQAFNDEELAKLFLANQQSQQMNPLDIINKQQLNRVGAYDASLADAKRASPSYIPMALSGQEAQMQSQMNAAKKGSLLQPMQVAAEKSQLENEQNKQGVLWTMQDIDKKLAAGGDVDAQGNVVQMTPNQIGFMQNKRKELASQLMTTPEWSGKETLNTADNDTKLAIERMQLEAAKYAADQNLAGRRAAAGNKGPTSAEAAMTSIILKNEFMDDNQKHKLLQDMFNAKVASGKNASGETMALVTNGDGSLSLGKQSVTPPVDQTIPTGPAPTALTDKDKAAVEWANSNPTDPRSIAIKAKLGIK